MVVINRRTVADYTASLDALVAEALDGLDDQLWSLADMTVSDVDNRDIWRSEMCAMLYARVETGIIRAQAEADDLFDELSAIGGWNAGAVIHSDDDELWRSTRKLIGRALGHAFDSEADEVARRGAFSSAIDGYVRRKVGRAADGAMVENVIGNKNKDVRYALVPTGFETCSFCAMLASHDFDFKKPPKEHFHNGCRCRVMPGRKGETKVDGYDPEAWGEIWERYEEIDAEGSLSPEERNVKKEAAYRKVMTTPEDRQSVKSAAKENRMRVDKTVQLPKAEFKMVCSALNDIYHARLEGRGRVYIPIRNAIYTVEVIGFDNYRIVGKEELL